MFCIFVHPSRHSLGLIGSVGVGEGLDSEVSDVLLDEVILESDLGDLDLGLLWDEILLSFSFLNDGLGIE